MFDNSTIDYGLVFDNSPGTLISFDMKIDKKVFFNKHKFYSCFRTNMLADRTA